jgi:hypothetical protein
MAMSAVEVWNTLGTWTWAGAVGSASAAGVAAWIAIRDGRERDAARRDDEAAQARSLTVEAEVPAMRYGPQYSAVLRVTNHGTLPVLAVHVERIVVQWVGDGPEWQQVITGGSAVVLPPGGTLQADVLLVAPNGERFPLDDSHLVSGVVTYRDAAGRAWRRWGNADPQRLLNASDTNRLPFEQGHKMVHLER